MNTYEIIIFAFSILSFVLGVFFIAKNSEENLIFGIFILLFSFNIFFNVLFWSRFNLNLFVQLKFTYLIPFSLYAPLFYFYMRKLIDDIDVTRKDFFHFVPFIITFICYGGYYLLKPSMKLKLFQEQTIRDHIILIPYFDVYLVCIMTLYCFVIFKKYNKSFKDDNNLHTWLRLMTYMFFVVVLMLISYYVLLFTKLITTEYDYHITMVMIFAVLISAYYSIRYPEIFNGMSMNETIPFVKYQRTGLSEQFSLEMKDKLSELMHTHKPYLKSDLRLGKLATMLDVSRNHASQIINEHYKTNFFDFVNCYRIKEAEKLMEQHDSLTIEDVLYQSGFNNKVSFYKAFRKIHGMTPTEYLTEKVNQ